MNLNYYLGLVVVVSAITLVWIDPHLQRLILSGETATPFHRNLLGTMEVIIVTVLLTGISWWRGGIAPIPTTSTSFALFAIGTYAMGISNFAVIMATFIAAVQQLAPSAGFAMLFVWLLGAAIDAFGVILIEISRLTNRVGG